MEQRSTRQRTVYSEPVRTEHGDADPAQSLLRDLHEEVARNSHKVQTVRAQMERMQSLLQDMQACKDTMEDEEDGSLLDLRRSLMSKVEELGDEEELFDEDEEEIDDALREGADTLEALLLEKLKGKQEEALFAYQSGEPSLPPMLRESLRGADLQQRPPSRGGSMPRSSDDSFGRPSAFRSVPSANSTNPDTESRRTLSDPPPESFIGGEFAADPLLFHQIGSLQDKREIISKYGHSTSSELPPSSSDGLTDRAYDSSLRNIGELAGMLSSELELPQPSVESESDGGQWSETSSESEDEHGDHRMITIFAREIIRQREREQQRRMQEDFVRTVSSLRPMESNVQESSPTREGDQRDFSKISYAEASMPLTAPEVSDAYAFQSGDADADQEELAPRPLPAALSRTTRNALGPAVEQGKSPAELRLEMERELLTQQRIFDTALEISDLRQNQLAAASAATLQMVLERARARDAEAKRREDLLQQRFMHESELTQIAAAAQLEIFSKDLEVEKERESAKQSCFVADLELEYQRRLEMARKTAENLEQMAALAEVERALVGRKASVEIAVQTDLPDRTPIPPSQPKSTSVLDISTFESEDSVVLGDDAGEEDYSAAFEEEVLSFSRATVKSYVPSVSSNSASLSVGTSTSQSAFPSSSKGGNNESAVARSTDAGSEKSIVSTAAGTDSVVSTARDAREVDYSTEFDAEPPAYVSADGVVSETKASGTREMEYSEEFDLVAPAFVAASHDTAPLIPSSIAALGAEYRAELDRRVASHEKALALRLQFLSSRKMYQLAVIERQKATMTAEAVKGEMRKVEIAFEEGRAEIERDRWAMQARTCRELRKLQDLQIELDEFKARMPGVRNQPETGKALASLDFRDDVSPSDSQSYEGSFDEASISYSREMETAVYESLDADRKATDATLSRLYADEETTADKEGDRGKMSSAAYEAVDEVFESDVADEVPETVSSKGDDVEMVTSAKPDEIASTADSELFGEVPESSEVVDEVSMSGSLKGADSSLPEDGIGQVSGAASVGTADDVASEDSLREGKSFDIVKSSGELDSFIVDNEYSYEEDFDETRSKSHLKESTSLQQDPPHIDHDVLTDDTPYVEHSVDTLVELEESVDRRRQRIEFLRSELEVVRSEAARKQLIREKEDERMRLLAEEETLLRELQLAKARQNDAERSGGHDDIYSADLSFEPNDDGPVDRVNSHDQDAAVIGQGQLGLLDEVDSKFTEAAKMWVADKVADLQQLREEELGLLSEEEDLHGDSFGSSQSHILVTTLLSKSAAAVRIQTVVRGFLTRQRILSMQRRLLEAQYTEITGDLVVESIATASIEDHILEDSFGSDDFETYIDTKEVALEQAESAAASAGRLLARMQEHDRTLPSAIPVAESGDSKSLPSSANSVGEATNTRIDFIADMDSVVDKLSGQFVDDDVVSLEDEMDYAYGSTDVPEKAAVVAVVESKLLGTDVLMEESVGEAIHVVMREQLEDDETSLPHDALVHEKQPTAEIPLQLPSSERAWSKGEILQRDLSLGEEDRALSKGGSEVEEEISENFDYEDDDVLLPTEDVGMVLAGERIKVRGSHGSAQETIEAEYEQSLVDAVKGRGVSEDLITEDEGLQSNMLGANLISSAEEGREVIGTGFEEGALSEHLEDDYFLPYEEEAEGMQRTTNDLIVAMTLKESEDIKFAIESDALAEQERPDHSKSLRMNEAILSSAAEEMSTELSVEPLVSLTPAVAQAEITADLATGDLGEISSTAEEDVSDDIDGYLSEDESIDPAILEPKEISIPSESVGVLEGKHPETGLADLIAPIDGTGYEGTHEGSVSSASEAPIYDNEEPMVVHGSQPVSQVGPISDVVGTRSTAVATEAVKENRIPESAEENYASERFVGIPASSVLEEGKYHPNDDAASSRDQVQGDLIEDVTYEAASTDTISGLDVMDHLKIEAVVESGWDIDVGDSPSQAVTADDMDFLELSQALTESLLRRLLAEAVDEASREDSPNSQGNSEPSQVTSALLTTLPPLHIPSARAVRAHCDDADDLYDFDDGSTARPSSTSGLSLAPSPADTFAAVTSRLNVGFIDFLVPNKHV